MLGIREEGDTPLIERLLDHLAARRTLLVLDNCEHVIDGVVALVEALLAGGGEHDDPGHQPRSAWASAASRSIRCARCRCRRRTTCASVLEAESVRVFVDRARLALPDFEVDAGNAAALAEICRRLDGIALAIELAAARVTMLSVAEIAARLDDRFRLLTGGSRALPRHQTLQAAMQWSYEQLTPDAAAHAAPGVGVRRRLDAAGRGRGRADRRRVRGAGAADRAARQVAARRSIARSRAAAPATACSRRCASTRWTA